jgi:hypothetical protein
MCAGHYNRVELAEKNLIEAAMTTERDTCVGEAQKN